MVGDGEVNSFAAPSRGLIVLALNEVRESRG
jgi:hypothetical protein